MKIKNFAFLISIILIFIVALGAVSADEGLNDHSAIYGDNGDIDDDSDYEDDDLDDDSDDWDDDSDYEDDDLDDDSDDSGSYYGIIMGAISNPLISPYQPNPIPKSISSAVTTTNDVGESDYGSDGPSDDLDDSSDDSDGGSEEELDDSSEDYDDDFDDTELDDADGNNENVPMATSGSASFDDGAENASSEDLSSKNQIDLANKATGHPILMLILSLFALFVIPANKR